MMQQPVWLTEQTSERTNEAPETSRLWVQKWTGLDLTIFSKPSVKFIKYSNLMAYLHFNSGFGHYQRGEIGLASLILAPCLRLIENCISRPRWVSSALKWPVGQRWHSSTIQTLTANRSQRLDSNLPAWLAPLEERRTKSEGAMLIQLDLLKNMK